MVSEWMSNGNINQFARENTGVNRYELVSHPFRFLAFSFVDTSVVGRSRQGLDSHARSGDGPRGFQRGMYSRACFLYLPLISFIYQGQYPHRLDRSRPPGGLWSAQNRMGRYKTTSRNSLIQGGTYRWMSPELFDPKKFGLKDDRRTRRSVCYVFGMVAVEYRFPGVTTTPLLGGLSTVNIR